MSRLWPPNPDSYEDNDILVLTSRSPSGNEQNFGTGHRSDDGASSRTGQAAYLV